ALNACDKYDWIKHSTTGVEPMIRWQSSTKALRIPPDATLNAAFKVAEYNVPLYNDVTIKVEGEIIQLSRQKTDGLSLVDYVGQKVTVLLPAGESWLVVITADGNEFTMDRLQATPDKAGEFKTLPETKGQRARKLLKEEAKAFKQQVKERREEDDEILVPHFDTKVDEQAKPLVFPRKQEAMPIAHIPGAAAFNQDRLLDRYQAYDWLIEQGYWSEPSDSETEWWKSLFTDREEITEAELRHAIEAQQAPGEVTYLRRA
ncbi:MAG TPA: hypothetical protein VEF04_01860, partial [Blastocatellia bacterium]|nr:hypothetical protein [Blastocatellia bacterium]